MKQMKLMITILIVALIISGCGSSTVGGLGSTQTFERSAEANIIVNSDSYPLTIIDYFGHETVLDELPQRIAVLAGTPLNIWYDVGGKSICSSDISDSNLKLIEEYREEMLDLPVVGAVYSLDMEAVLAQKPDLVITQAGVQTSETKMLRDMNVPVVTTLARSFEDVVDLYLAFGKILGHEELAQEKVAKLVESRQAIIDKAPAEGKSVVILYLTASSLSVKLDNSIAGEIAQSLNIKNIASDLPPDVIGSEHTPLDIEYIVEQNPDMVLVTSMIASNELAKSTMEQHFSSNQAWQSVPAVREGRVVYLPQEYFLYNGGPYFAEAVYYMAASVYPEIYGSIDE